MALACKEVVAIVTGNDACTVELIVYFEQCGRPNIAINVSDGKVVGLSNSR